LPNSFGRKGYHLAVTCCNKKLNGVATDLTVFNKALLGNRRVDQLELFFPTMRAGKIMLYHNIKIMAIIIFLDQ
jgi:hypothetical protein